MYKETSHLWLMFLFASISICIGSTCYADGDSNGGKVVHVGSVEDTIVFSISSNTSSNRPACATSARFSVHKDSSHAPLVLMAFATATELAHVRGKGTCTLWPNSEDLRWLELCPYSGCN